MPMDFASNYEIARTADYIRSKNFTRVALQFPDELLKDSTRVVRELREELWRSGNVSDVGLYVMADTAYGSCCVDEVGASHISADCVVHYGHTCLSPTSTLPAFFVFGKASINVNACAKSLSDCLSTSDKPIMVLYGLEYVHAVQSIKEAAIVESSKLCQSNLGIYYADVICSALNPSKENKTDNRLPGSFNDFSSNGELSDSIEGSRIGQQMNSTTAGTSYNLGGLTWNLPEGRKMVDCLLFWIGSDNPAFANFVLTFNDSEIVRYEADRNCLVKDLSHKKRILKRRYYLVEKAKDANIIGILVGTLGIAGYLQMIHRMKDLIKGVGKKAYILVMGKPNPAKLANFPECDVFIYVSCAQTALLDSKEFLAPVITPFEAMLAFNRGSQWTGEYVMEFRDLMASSLENGNRTEEARFSFLQGGYVEDLRVQGEQEEIGLALAEATEKSLKVQGKSTSSVFVKGTAKSGAEFLAARSYRGLEVHSDKLSPRSFVMGRSGKASGYEDEKNKQED